MGSVRFTPNLAGIREVLRGHGVTSELADIAREKAREANDAARSHNRTWRTDHYVSSTEQRATGSVGKVSTDGTWAGLMDQARHHTLDQINH